jgi:hypothetical protein
MELESDQREFLDNRLLQLSETQPELLLLKDKLLKIGGCHLVAPTKPEPDLSPLLLEGVVMTGPVEFEEMARNSCHWNSAHLWTSRRNSIVGIGTGYALSEDGLWRQHSWALTSIGILETTEPRHTYFGLRLEGHAADQFSAGYVA